MPGLSGSWGVTEAPVTDFRDRLEALRQAQTDGCVSDFELDRFFVGEVTVTEAAAIQARIDACPHCQARLEAFGSAQRDFQSHPDPIWLGRARTRRLFTAAGVAVAAAAAVLLFVRAPTDGPEVIRFKGSDRFGFVIVAPGGEVRGDQESGVASPGDELQWRFRTSKKRFVAVLARDPSGKGRVYYPEGPRAELLEPGPERTLPLAIELDETSGRETIVGLICTEAVLLEPIRDAVERGSAEAPAGCDAHRFVLTKTERR